MRDLFKRAVALVLLTALALTCFMSAAAGEMIMLPDDLASEAAMLIDGKTGYPLFEKNADRAMYPASTTKIMTCLLALEYGHLDEEVTIPKEAGEVPKDSSLVPVQVGEFIRMRDLLYGFMLMSGNDAANAIAVIVGGSIENFVDMMNQKARELGMTGTHFANAHGYHTDNHYTTARDLCLLTMEAMKNETFREIVSTTHYVIDPSNKRSSSLKVINTNEMLIPTFEYYYEDLIGVKTGFTKSAGQTFVFAAQRDDVLLIGVAMKSSTSKDSSLRWEDTKKLCDYGFTRYKKYGFTDLYSRSPATVQIAGASSSDPMAGELELAISGITGTFTVSCMDGNLSDALSAYADAVRYDITAELTAPITAGTIIGTLEYEGITAVLVASRSVEAEPEAVQGLIGSIDLEAVGRILRIALIVLIACFVLRGVISAANKKKRRKRKKKKRASSSYYGRGDRDRYGK